MPFDVVVVGGGLVGAALTRALRGAAIALVAPERVAPPADGFDSRVYAISPGNARFLAELQAWQRLPEACLTPVHAMRVYGDAARAMLEFDAYDAGVPELAWIVEDGRLQFALRHGLETQDRLERFDAATCERLDIGAAHAVVLLSDGRRLEASLVVGADGAGSRVREQAGLAIDVRAYGQKAVVANFACERAHDNVALQWFQGGAVLALLPLPGNHVSMVWSTQDAEAERLLDLAPDELAREVRSASRNALGEFAVVTPARAFPLQRMMAQRIVAPRVALAGDAAHVLHPLAGQGANLGLHDARMLAHTLAAREPGRDLGDLRLLRRYERARAEDILAMRATVHGLFRLFAARGAVPAWLRNAGLGAVHRLAAVKNLLMRRAMS
jgi:2-octaprenylphenol hydroxylase